ncbi:sulfotransferase [Actinocorallia longicatena]|uniref:Sulfotransferase n=1 Tax=Actinocorallia longicatena TaxID=111803 RepID=A0ABP6Q968_9ACTN
MKVHLADLAVPCFSPEAAEVLKAMSAMAPGFSLTPEALMEGAAEQAGLSEFGDPSFLAGLTALCDAYRDDDALSPYGLVAQHVQLTQLLVNRLRLEDLVARRPEILDVEVKAPIIIAGMPRTGTTHLQNLLAADPALTHLPYWEAVEPFPLPGDTGRLDRTVAALDFVYRAMPHFRSMFDITPTHAHEDINLLAMEFSSMHFEVQALVPSYRDWYLSADQTPAYAYLRKALQALAWLRGDRRRWVLKTPQHLEQLGPLLRIFPDATVVFTHRDPVACTASMATMICYAYRMSRAEMDPHAVGRYWADRSADLLNGCMRDHGLVPPDQVVDVRFHEFTTDNMAAVRRIYEVADQPLGAASERAFAAFLAGHGRGRHGQVDYRLDDLGLDERELRRELTPYSERFGLPADQR